MIRMPIQQPHRLFGQLASRTTWWRLRQELSAPSLVKKSTNGHLTEILPIMEPTQRRPTAFAQLFDVSCGPPGIEEVISAAPGYKTPQTADWVDLLPEEAVERLADALKLPGVYMRSWSAGWPVDESDEGRGGASEDAADEAPAEKLDVEARIMLPSVQSGTRDRALEIAMQRAHERWGVVPTEDAVPADVMSPQEFAELLMESVKQARNESLWTRAAGG